MDCPKCGASGFLPGLVCSSCGAASDENYQGGRRRTRGRLDDSDGGSAVSDRDQWKFQILPLVAVAALLAILLGAILYEVSIAQADSASTIGEIERATDAIRNASRLLLLGIVLMAFAVAGVSIEYRP